MTKKIERISKQYADDKLKGAINNDDFSRHDKMIASFDYFDIAQAFEDGANWMQDYQDSKNDIGEDWMDTDIVEPNEYHTVLLAYKNKHDSNYKYCTAFRNDIGYFDMVTGHAVKADFIWWTELES